MTNSSRIYYVNQMTGSDANDGLSKEHPFASLFRINQLSLQPGDQVLLAGGNSFCGQFLQLKDSGTKEAPIVIGSYDVEDDIFPVIAADGQGIWYQDYGIPLDSPAHIFKGYVSSAILLYDAEHIVVENLEITNTATDIIGERYSAPHKMNRTGVAVVAKDKGLRSGITLRNLRIHDVNGNVYDKHMNNGGIYMTALKPDHEEVTGIARYRDILVEDCFVYRVSRWGIAVGYTYAHEKFQGAEPENRFGKVAAAIWPWKCKDALFRYNEVADTRLNQDGMAYDADSGDGTVYEYNYSRQNEGGCVMFCLQEAIHNTFRHNVSFDDLGGTISPSENPDALLSHNTFYVREGVPFVRKNMDGGKFTEEENQIIPLSLS